MRFAKTTQLMKSRVSSSQVRAPEPRAVGPGMRSWGIGTQVVAGRTPGRELCPRHISDTLGAPSWCPHC